MPIYEYRCAACGGESSRIWMRLPSAAEETALACPACGARGLARLFSRFASPRSDERRMESLAEGGGLDGLDGDDPRGMARMMRRISEESGEPIEGEDAEALGRLEAGEMPPDDDAGGAGADADDAGDD